MSVVMVGLSHHGAPVEVRERLAFTNEGALTDALRSLRQALGDRGECVLLSTCNRTELYLADGDNLSARELGGLLVAVRGLPDADFAPYWEERREHRAIEHLFRVAAGLESMMLGEPDIVRQVKIAYARAADVGATGPTLNRLFHQALFVGKRVRTETQLGRGAFSVGHAAAAMAESIFGSLAGRTVLLLGAGDMSEATARHLVSAGASAVLVANRTFDRAVVLAEALGGRAIGYEAFPEHLSRADIVIASTAAPHPIVHKAQIAEAMRGRPRRPLFLIDIAVPRDVDADVGDLDGVFLYNIDDLRAVVEADQAERRQEALRAEAVVAEEAAAFAAALRTTREAAPLVSSLRAKWEEIRRAELARLRERLPHLSPEEWQAVEITTRSIVNRIAHEPTRTIKDLVADPDGSAPEKMDTVRALFGLQDEERTGTGEETTP